MKGAAVVNSGIQPTLVKPLNIRNVTHNKWPKNVAWDSSVSRISKESDVEMFSVAQIRKLKLSDFSVKEPFCS